MKKKTIKNITITATYTAGFGEWEVPQNVYRGLQKIEDEHCGNICHELGTTCDDNDVLSAFEWLGENVHSNDAYEWSYEILDFE